MKSMTVKCTRAFHMEGIIIKPDEIVELTRSDALELLDRGAVVLISERPLDPEQPEE
jgi:hypothetical protein